MSTKQPEALAGRPAAHTDNAPFGFENNEKSAWSVGFESGYDAARLEIASLRETLASQAQPAGAATAKVLAGVIELAKVAHAHWDADRDAKVGKILMAMAGWNEGYDWRADALHAAAASPQPAAQALDSVRVFWQQHTQADALSMTMAELHNDAELVIRAAIAAQQGGANG